MDGKSISWHEVPGVMVRSIAHYKTGQAHGVWEIYDKKGNLISKSKYKNGIKVEDLKKE